MTEPRAPESDDSDERAPSLPRQDGLTLSAVFDAIAKMFCVGDPNAATITLTLTQGDGSVVTVTKQSRGDHRE